MSFYRLTREKSQVSYSKLSEYLLVALPDKSLTAELMSYQAELVRHYGQSVETLPVRHVLLAVLTAKESMEETLRRWLMKICRLQTAYTLEFNPVCDCKQGVLTLQVKDSSHQQTFNSRLHVVDDFMLASDCLPLQVIPELHLPLLILTNRQKQNVRESPQPSFTRLFPIKEVAMLKRSESWEAFERLDVFGLNNF